MTNSYSILEELKLKLTAHINQLYPELDANDFTSRCISAIGKPVSPGTYAPKPGNLWSEEDILLITYGNSLKDANSKPLHSLRLFLHEYLKDIITTVHILPFFPFSSDDGFAVIDYTQVDPLLGDWNDISDIAKEFKLMSDLVINHVSSQSRWFKNFQYNKEPGKDYFIETSPDYDLSIVVRPRTSPLLRPTETADGTKYVWCTFSHDQIDLNFSNPQVLLEFIHIISAYLETGIQWIRLDAVAFLWKEIGTSCIHLHQTHEMIKLLRALSEYKNPNSVLVSETNVPNHENLTYFGNCNEAHLIYNFSLPPLVLHSLMSGRSEHLKKWIMSMPPAPMGCTYLNFTASHDGIGLRPAEGLLSEIEIETLVETMETYGGKITRRTGKEGIEKPYEINISFFEAMRGTYKGTDQWQMERFLCSQIMMMSLEGIPGFYIHSLFATPNDLDKLRATQENRSINRKNWEFNELIDLLKNPETVHAQIFKRLSSLIATRKKQSAFHPGATQFTLHMQPEIFAFWRQSIKRDQSIFCLNNLSDLPQKINLGDLNLINTQPWFDLISGTHFEETYASLELQPYQCIWLTNKF